MRDIKNGSERRDPFPGGRLVRNSRNLQTVIMNDPLVTLLTDFGCSGSYVAQMKGVILGIAPKTRIIDVTHEIPAQNVFIAARALESVFPVFPVGTIHVCVVDPGVGSDRRFLLVRAKGQFILAPDNGLVSPLLERIPEHEIRELNGGWFVRTPCSPTFHGRDLVAPAAGFLAAGRSPEEFGSLISKPPLRLLQAMPAVTGSGILGEIVEIDHFGNLLTNMTTAHWNGHSPDKLEVVIGDRAISPLRKYYSQVAEGELLALVSSFETLEIACRNGNAAKLLGATRGMKVEVRFRTIG